MSLNPRSIATLGIGFGPRHTATLGLWPTTVPPIPAPEPDGAGGRRRRTAIWPVKYTKYNEPKPVKQKYKPAPVRIHTARGLVLTDIPVLAEVKPKPWAKGGAATWLNEPPTISVDVDAIAKGRVSITPEEMIDMVMIALDQPKRQKAHSIEELTNILLLALEDSDE